MPALVDQEARGDEAGALLAFLEAQRGGIRRAVLGLTDEQAERRSTVSELTLAGLVKHVAEVEQSWVEDAKGIPHAIPRDHTNWHLSFRLEEGQTLAGTLAYWDQVAAETERFVRSLPDLDGTFPLPKAPWFPEGSVRSTRFLLLTLIQEVARHAGHADVIREAIDGKTAFELVREAQNPSRAAAS
ncbi:DinB family protein [Streptomyces sp. B1866]|uniref:DinB family protein n=1 Tax=Streptomyces sp. B1866 TaxID=3075431 RepID=UPI00288FC941|nr:DinB family protein [Streptomyces sp. B1866]MDT3396485.1 DinB family protein [Streptomyces sp. B1866]